MIEPQHAGSQHAGSQDAGSQDAGSQDVGSQDVESPPVDGSPAGSSPVAPAGDATARADDVERILAFVNETLNPHAEPVTDPSANLIEAAILDSIGMLELVVFLESSFGVRVASEDLSAAHFADARSIARYVASAKAGG